MAVTDELERAREHFDAGEWGAALRTWESIDQGRLSADDLEDLAVAAYLVGRDSTAAEALQRAFQTCIDDADTLGAARRACWIAMIMSMAGQPAVGQGWASRAERLLDEFDEDVEERGYLEMNHVYAHLAVGELDEATESARRVADAGRRFANPDLFAAGISAEGRIILERGNVREGLALFDEAMVSVTAGEVSAVFAGMVYCTMIEGCQDVSDFGRAAAWTAALSQWCDRQPGLVPYRGQCAVHRGQICALHGAFSDAITEFDDALRRYRETSSPAAGFALALRGDIYRLTGEPDSAEDSYEQAAEFGYEPQPGLALLWLSRGRRDAALGAIRRLLVESQQPVERSRILPAAIEILIAAGELEQARESARELDHIACGFSCVALQAMAAYAAGAVELSDGDPAGALPYLRKARQLWIDLDCPYETARAQVLIGRGLRALSDTRSADATLAAAHRTFVDLGAKPAADEVAGLLTPEGFPAGLTDREVEVLRLVATGRSNGQIAAELVLSEKTVSRHLTNIFTKLDVNTRSAATAYAYEHGLM
ncbi:LuxR family transcriptional regulator [Gordonia rhizosphera]|nr:LuxR family transcriptional regulator [Gordonia rhizosphera]